MARSLMESGLGFTGLSGRVQNDTQGESADTTLAIGSRRARIDTVLDLENP